MLRHVETSSHPRRGPVRRSHPSSAVRGRRRSPAASRKTDGNDVAGPLDLASMRLTPINGGDRIQIRTLAPFTAAQLDGDAGWFEVDFDTNADRKYDFWAVVLYAKGKLLAIQGQGQNVLRKLARASRRRQNGLVRHRTSQPRQRLELRLRRLQHLAREAMLGIQRLRRHDPEPVSADPPRLHTADDLVGSRCQRSRPMCRRRWTSTRISPCTTTRTARASSAGRCNSTRRGARGRRSRPVGTKTVSASVTRGRGRGHVACACSRSTSRANRAPAAPRRPSCPGTIERVLFDYSAPADRRRTR